MSQGNQRKTFAAKSKEEVAEYLNEREMQAVEDIDDIKWLFSTVQGRRIAWRTMELAVLELDPFTKDAETYHILGRQASAQRIRRVAQVECTEDFLKMIKENARRASLEKNKEPKQVTENNYGNS